MVGKVKSSKIVSVITSNKNFNYRSDDDNEEETIKTTTNYQMDIKYVGEKRFPVIKCRAVVSKSGNVKIKSDNIIPGLKDSNVSKTKKLISSVATKLSNSTVTSNVQGKFIDTRINFSNSIGYYLEKRDDYAAELRDSKNAPENFASHFQQSGSQFDASTSYRGKNDPLKQTRVDCKIASLEELCNLRNRVLPHLCSETGSVEDCDVIIRCGKQSERQLVAPTKLIVSRDSKTTKSVGDVSSFHRRDGILRINTRESNKRQKLVRFQDPLESKESVKRRRHKKLQSCLKGSKSDTDEVLFKSEVIKTSICGDYVPTCFPFVLNKPRHNKKLLVLDLDETLANFLDVPRFCPHIARRPFLEEFLGSIYRYYDIAIWGNNRIEQVLEKLKCINLTVSNNYKLFFCLDIKSISKVYISNFGVCNVKSLSLIWDRYPQYDWTNTVMVDDQITHMYYNSKQGLLIEPYLQMNNRKDRELKYLSRYLRRIAIEHDFSHLDHSLWRDKSRKSKRQQGMLWNIG